MIRSAFLAITLLLCGVANADPSTSPHDPAGHGLELHQELAQPMFCVASYRVWMEVIAADPGVPSLYKREMKNRFDGLLDELDSYVTEIGHNDDAAFDTMIEMYNNVVSLVESDFQHWLELVQVAGCKEVTDKYAGPWL